MFFYLGFFVLPNNLCRELLTTWLHSSGPDNTFLTEKNKKILEELNARLQEVERENTKVKEIKLVQKEEDKEVEPESADFEDLGTSARAKHIEEILAVGDNNQSDNVDDETLITNFEQKWFQLF